MRLGFQLQKQATGSRARAAVFRTLHNEVRTPLFMPVGTRATVRSQTIESLTETGSQVLLANTYHLLIRPGPEVFRRAGGIHNFMKWNKSVLTDSGGFQVFSLPESRNMTEEGALFRSYIDGTKILLSPELSIEMQRAIGSDIMMVLDQCIPSTAERVEAKAAMELTHRWAKRSLLARGDSPQSMFGIVQGACFEDLRKQSAEVLSQMPFDGFAIGGLAVGESKAEREDMTEFTAQFLPKDLPRYLMGVGTPIDLLEAVHRGVDMFDCIIPTALAQRGVAFTAKGKLLLRRSVYKFSQEPIDPDCGCPTCASYSRSYLHHLNKTEEILGWQLIGHHNLYFYHRMMNEIRESILADRFMEYYRANRELLASADEENPARPQKANRRKKEAPLILGDYEVCEPADGIARIRQISSGEIMHSVNDPQAEANRLYVDQSELERKILEQKEIVIWDVGLGAATNAMAVIRRLEKIAAAENPESDRKFANTKIISFENDLNSLRLTLHHPHKFEHVRHSAPGVLLQDGRWQSTKHPSLPIEWQLVEGDFLEKIQMKDLPAPDLIFYDPFSYKADSLLWTVQIFEQLKQKCGKKSAELYTYSASTAVRASLLGAGFYVAKGVATGPKAETTIGLTQLPNSATRFVLLDREWLARWNRSGAKIPPSVDPSRREAFEAAILNHRQFMLPSVSE